MPTPVYIRCFGYPLMLLFWKTKTEMKTKKKKLKLILFYFVQCNGIRFIAITQLLLFQKNQKKKRKQALYVMEH